MTKTVAALVVVPTMPWERLGGGGRGLRPFTQRQPLAAVAL